MGDLDIHTRTQQHILHAQSISALRKSCPAAEQEEAHLGKSVQVLEVPCRPNHPGDDL